jgi:cytochrome c oxidase subunit 2
MMRKAWIAGAGLMATCLMTATAVAQAPGETPGTGQPREWQLGLQGAATPIAEGIAGFHTFLLWIIVAISLFVLGLLIYCVYRYNSKANPTPSRFTHNTTVEVVWTVVPVLILVAIAIPSFRLLKAQEEIPPADITIKVTGYQWYWGIEYVQPQAQQETGGFKFDIYMLRDANNNPARGPNGEPRTLAVDNEIVLPVNAVVRVQVTAGDVLHSFAMPALGIKRDAVPGRLNETWFKATREGVYYGQCSELCGTNHAYMPASIRIVRPERYAAWLGEAQKKFASTDSPVRTAQRAPEQQ